MPIKIDEGKSINILYTNWEKVTKVRSIVPMRLWFGHTKWHPEDQWLLQARDVEKNASRDFAMKDIHKWFVNE